MSMATNITSSQALLASSAVTSIHTSNSSAANANVELPGPSNTSIATHSAQAQGSAPTRTEELILAELQRLSSRMSNMEQEIQSKTYTSTPKKRKKARQVNKSREQSMVGVSALTDTQSTINDSATDINQLVSGPSTVIRPVITVVTSSSSMCTQARVVTTTATGVTSGCVRPSTQTTDASCQGGHYRHHIPQGPRPSISQTLSTPVVSSMANGMARTSQASVVFNPMVQTRNTQAGAQGSPQGVQPHNNLQPSLSQQQWPMAANPQSQCMCRGGQIVTQTGLEQVAPSRVQPLNCNQQGWNQTSVQASCADVGITALQHSNDQVLIPSIQALRTTAVDQDLVQRRLTELHQQALPQQAGNNTHQLSQQDISHKHPSKPKGKKDKVEVVWPQDCAFVGHLRARLTYEQLNQSQFVLGFLRSIQEEVNTLIRSNMVEYLTELFQDVCDMGWVSAKGAHLVVMSKMEEGLVTWQDLKKVNKIRKTYVRSSFATNSSSTQEYSGPNSKKGNRKQSTIPCKDFNEGKCQKNYDHEVGLITHKHICNFCLYSLNKQYNHSENVCNRKRAKNGQGVHQ